MNNIEGMINTVHNMDAIEFMKLIPDNSIDMILCDPPYGMGKTKLKWDSIIPIDLMWEQIIRITKRSSAILLFAGEPYSSMLRMSNLEMYRYQWYWDKGSGSNFGQSAYQPLRILEDILVFSRGVSSPAIGKDVVHCKYYPQRNKLPQKYVYKDKEHHRKIRNASLSSHVHNSKPKTRVYEYDTPKNVISISNRAEKERGLHPTQKPVELCEYLIKSHSLENEIILDFTAGSGTTAIAAMRCNRNYIVNDINKEYIDIINTRIKNNKFTPEIKNKDGTRQLSLFNEEQE